MSDIVNDYINGLIKAHKEKNKDINLITHASENEIKRIRNLYPDVPEDFIDFISKTDGVTVDKDGFSHRPSLFSIYEGHVTYRMVSINEIIHDAESGDITLAEIYPWFLDEDADDDESACVEMDLHARIGDRILFAENSGVYALYIDLKPSKLGTVGQIISYVHDPDSYSLVCNSFSDLLKQSVDSDFKYFFSEFDE